MEKKICIILCLMLLLSTSFCIAEKEYESIFIVEGTINMKQPIKIGEDICSEIQKSGIIKDGKLIESNKIGDKTYVYEGIKNNRVMISERSGMYGITKLPLKNNQAIWGAAYKEHLIITVINKEKDITVETGSLEDSKFAGKTSEIGIKLGLEVQDLTKELAQRFGYEPGEGVIVSSVARNSEADRVGIEPRMLIISVDRVTVTSTSEFNAALEKAEKN